LLRVRLLVAALIILPLLAIVVADYWIDLGAPGILLVPVGLVAGLVAAAEILDMLKANGHDPAAWSVYTGITLVIVAAAAPLGWGLVGAEYPPDCPLGKLGWPLFAAAIASVLPFIAELLRYKEPGRSTVNVALSIFIIVYLGLSIAFVAELRFFHSNEWGMAALVSLLLITKFSDAGAYFAGKSLGRHKLSPVISPGKTVEGAIGGVLAACLASWVFFQFIAPRMVPQAAPTPLWGTLVYGLLIATAGIVGDLAESLLKRDLGRKDSSRWLPGLGGVLDILDSVLIAAPPAFMCWAAGIVGPAA
jgi:phosphatidate cytidylyltransferase